MIKITVIACGTKMPDWVGIATKKFSKHLNEFISFSLIEIALTKRNKNADLARLMLKESALINAAIPNNARIIALVIKGESFNSEKLAEKLESLHNKSSHLCFIIGGPEGLCQETLQKCHEHWSLSELTLPHPLVRIILLEALYRGYSILNNHPYHRI